MQDISDPLLPWFFVRSAPGLGNHRFRRLWEAVGPPSAVLSSDAQTLREKANLPEATISYLLGRKVPDDVKMDLDEARKAGASVVTIADDCYPALLRQVPYPPPFLYVYGSLSASSRAVALVGSRSPSGYGLDVSRRMARDLAAAGVTVVSGGARGIDTAAHEGALSGGGRTCAVLGCGLSLVYPAENRDLFEAVAQSGAVVSEFPMNAKPEAWRFPPRNRIISGMSAGVVVVEAAARSGSLITARLAGEQNREVFAVPGSVTSLKSAGTHRLIRQGACLVESAADILEVLEPLFGHLETALGEPLPAPEPSMPPDLTQDEALVYGALEAYPIHVDELCRKVGLSAGVLSGVLLSLELSGLVRQAPGKLFVRGER